MPEGGAPDSRWSRSKAPGAALGTCIPVAAMLATLCACNLQHSPEQGSPATPKTSVPVILISIDTLRADALGCHGYERDTTPVLDSFAQSAVRFENAIVQSNSTPSSHAAMLTGIDPTALRRGARVEAGERALDAETESYGYGLIDELTPTIQSRLREAGWTTGGFTAHEAWLGTKNGFHIGFDHFETGYDAAPENHARVQRWLETTPGRPLFLFVHDYDVHSDFQDLPYRVPPPFFGRYSSGYLGGFTGTGEGHRKASVLLQWMFLQGKSFGSEEIRYLRDLYDEGVRFTDHQVGSLFELLKRHGLWDEALIIVTADHGEEFQEHRGLLHYQLYDEVLHVPLLMRFPQARWGGVVVRPQVRCIDIVPTILDYLGLEPMEFSQGESLLPLIESAAAREISADAGRESFSFGRASGALRTRNAKLFARHDKREEFYDLASDPGERVNLIGRPSEEIERFRARLIELYKRASSMGDAIAAMRRHAGSKTNAFSDEDLERLRALGYTGE